MDGAVRWDDLDRRMMALALREARKGRPSPNPHVGAVLAHAGEVIAVAHHRRAGLAHAEVAAIERAGTRTKGATLYVSFEPCNHHGRTGPCTEAIIEAGIARVVVGCVDPAPHVPGASDRLRAAGLDVELGLFEDEARELIADFTKHITTGLPHITLKAAVSLDGRVATRTGDSRWITGDRARRQAHRMRARADAVLVGVGTVLADDPELTVRHVRGRNPLRVVVDTRLRTPLNAKLVVGARQHPTMLFHAPDPDPSRREALRQAGVSLIEVPAAASGGVALEAVLRELGERDVVRLLVEGGPRLAGALLDEGLVDRVAVFVAPCIVGDARARSFAEGRGVERIADALRVARPSVRRFGPDVLIEGDIAGDPQESGEG